MCNFLRVIINYDSIESYGSGQNALESGQNSASCFARAYDEKLHMALNQFCATSSGGAYLRSFLVTESRLSGGGTRVAPQIVF
ncbi:MAG: hypothetical protein JWR69_1328 [Pedosphaera sp.]|nr:hypothetical protein [Pedosphaera sp.]